MSNKRTIINNIKKSINNASSSNTKDLCTFCVHMLEANEQMDELSKEYEKEKDSSITKRYLNWSEKNKEFPLQRFNGIITFVNNPKNKQGLGRIFRKSSIVQISELVKKALNKLDSLMKKIGGHQMWKRIIKYNNEARDPISYKTAAIIYDGIVVSRKENGETSLINLDVAKNKENDWLPPICDFFGYEANPYSHAGEYFNIFENVYNCNAKDD